MILVHTHHNRLNHKLSQWENKGYWFTGKWLTELYSYLDINRLEVYWGWATPTPTPQNQVPSSAFIPHFKEGGKITIPPSLGLEIPCDTDAPPWFKMPYERERGCLPWGLCEGCFPGKQPCFYRLLTFNLLCYLLSSHTCEQGCVGPRVTSALAQEQFILFSEKVSHCFGTHWWGWRELSLPPQNWHYKYVITLGFQNSKLHACLTSFLLTHVLPQNCYFWSNE